MDGEVLLRVRGAGRRRRADLGAPSPRTSRARSGAGAHDPVRRPGRVSPSDPTGPTRRTSAGRCFHSTREAKADIERFGGHAGQVHRGRRHGRVRRAGRPRRRSRARGPRRTADPRRRWTSCAQTDPTCAVRVAVNTGEAMVSFGEGPQVGRGASPATSSTPHRGCRDWRRTVGGDRRVHTAGAVPRPLRGWRPSPPPRQGKSEPLQVWRVLGERSGPAVDARRPRSSAAGTRCVCSGSLRPGWSRPPPATSSPSWATRGWKDAARGRGPRATEGRARWLTGRCSAVRGVGDVRSHGRRGPGGRRGGRRGPARGTVREAARVRMPPASIRTRRTAGACCRSADDLGDAAGGGDGAATGTIAAVEVADAGRASSRPWPPRGRWSSGSRTCTGPTRSCSR